MKFKNRTESGKQLAELLQMYRGQQDVLVLGIPCGGIVVAAEVAKELNLPLDVLVARTFGALDQPDLVVGGITADGTILFKDDLMDMLGVTQQDLAETVAAELAHARHHLSLYRTNKSALNVANKTVLVVDDGIASCSPIRAAIAALRTAGARKIIVAVPVAPADSLDAISQEADDVICLETPELFPSIGFFYASYPIIEDAEVIELLKYQPRCQDSELIDN